MKVTKETTVTIKLNEAEAKILLDVLHEAVDSKLLSDEARKLANYIFGGVSESLT